MNADDIALTLQPGLGSRGIAHLISVMGSATNVFAATEEELVGRAELRREIARDIGLRNYHRQAEKEIAFLRKYSLWALASTDEAYPAMLRECPDFPHVIYIHGNAAVFQGRRALSMVGTRRITPYGQRMCEILTGRVAEIVPDTVIVSGLAFGVDANCHKAALDHGLPTVGVVANAFPGVTPAQNSRLADAIVESGGAVITELHSGTKQNGAYYIPRNRIIAGIGEGTVVVESPTDGGSLSTAALAYGYDRAVMAVPGRAGDRCSQGANLLIKHKKASMVCSGDDIVHELGWDIERAGEVPRSAVERPLLSAAEQRLVACFAEGESVDMDTLAIRSGYSVGETAAMLLNLEIGGEVRSLPGKIYELK